MSSRSFSTESSGSNSVSAAARYFFSNSAHSSGVAIVTESMVFPDKGRGYISILYPAAQRRFRDGHIFRLSAGQSLADGCNIRKVVHIGASCFFFFRPIAGLAVSACLSVPRGHDTSTPFLLIPVFCDSGLPRWAACDFSVTRVQKCFVRNYVRFFVFSLCVFTKRCQREGRIVTSKQGKYKNAQRLVQIFVQKNKRRSRCWDRLFLSVWIESSCNR